VPQLSGWLFVLFVSAMLAFTPVAFARSGGGHDGGGHGGSVYVHGYTRSNGTTVAPYWRSAPGTAGSSSSGSGAVHDYWTGRQSMPSS
jgi:hypothetical protein